MLIHTTKQFVLDEEEIKKAVMGRFLQLLGVETPVNIESIQLKANLIGEYEIGDYEAVLTVTETKEA